MAYEFKKAPLPARFKIGYSFAIPEFDYILPLTGVDVEFLKERRKEVRYCFEQLAKRIGQINIVTSKGVAEMDTASKLTKYYFYAAKCIENKYLDLTTDRLTRKPTREETESYENHMREMYRERST